MMGFIKRLWRDRRGNALVIAGAALPVVVGAGGLATDTIQWTMWKRELQRAADSAAYAGVYARVQDNAGMNAEQAASNDLSKNNTTGINLLGGYPQISYPTGSGYTDGVQVALAVRKTWAFRRCSCRKRRRSPRPALQPCSIPTAFASSLSRRKARRSSSAAAPT